MLNWKEKLSSHLGLTTSEIHDIEKGHNHDNLELQRFATNIPVHGGEEDIVLGVCTLTVHMLRYHYLISHYKL